MNDWPKQAIAFDDAVDLVHDRLFQKFVGPHRSFPSSNGAVPAPAQKNRQLVKEARERLFQALSEGRLTLWARTIRSTDKGGTIEQKVPPLSVSIDQNGHMRTGYWKGMRLISGRTPDNADGKIIRNLAEARDRVLDRIAFEAWLDVVFSSGKTEFPTLVPASKHELTIALKFLVTAVTENDWPYLSEDEVLNLVRPAFERMGRLAQVDRIRNIFWEDIRPATWPKKKGPRKLQNRKRQIEQLSCKLQELLLEVFSIK